MKIIICCEGPTDIGPITSLMKKCFPSHKLEIDCRTHAELRKTALLKSELPRGFIKEGPRLNRIAFIRRLWHEANTAKSEYVGLHQDLGHLDFPKIYQDIHNDFNIVLPSTIKRIAIIPKEMIESWLLADERAYPTIPDSPKLPAKPEELWGQKGDPVSNYPYNYFVRVLAQFRLADNRDIYAEIAEKISIEALLLRCPVSFGQFHADMQAFIAPEGQP